MNDTTLTAHWRAIQQHYPKLPAPSAECIPLDDRIGRHSRDGWRLARQTAVPDALTVVQAETLTLDALQQAVAEHRPDILVISAH
ncbi:hypothetical protein [Streptomyces californicus]|uniref:hypothetical protein n=1 Tax=Streptomyces californicus TaxID=67351 RepID=UPI003711C2DD